MRKAISRWNSCTKCIQCQGPADLISKFVLGFAVVVVPELQQRVIPRRGPHQQANAL